MTLYDKNRRPILPLDVLKIYHFTAAVRREKMYMYKRVNCIEKLGNSVAMYLKIEHLSDRNGGYYHEIADDSVREDIEIVQGYGPDGEQDFRDRKRKSKA